eukprot:767017-Hanusia_phi.AAC.5
MEDQYRLAVVTYPGLSTSCRLYRPIVTAAALRVTKFVTDSVTEGGIAGVTHVISAVHQLISPANQILYSAVIVAAALAVCTALIATADLRGWLDALEQASSLAGSLIRMAGSRTALYQPYRPMMIKRGQILYGLGSGPEQDGDNAAAVAFGVTIAGCFSSHTEASLRPSRVPRTLRATTSFPPLSAEADIAQRSTSSPSLRRSPSLPRSRTTSPRSEPPSLRPSRSTSSSRPLLRVLMPPSRLKGLDPPAIR